jgi:hypothetical protein
MKRNEGVEATIGNTIGKAGIGSLPKGGYFTSGNNNNFGINFTPHGEPNFKSYKSMKHSKKNIRKKMKRYSNFIKEYHHRNIADPVSYDEIELIDISFYDTYNGFIRFKGDGKVQRDHIRLYDYGNIQFDKFYSEEIYFQLVAYVYENLPDNKIKTSVEEYFDLKPLSDESYDIVDLIKNEDACATMVNTGGMGPISPSLPSSTPGDVAGSTPGSGDIGQVFGTYTKTGLNQRKKRKKETKIKSFQNFLSIN